MSQYATAAEFALYGLPAAATSDLLEADIISLIEAASAVVDGMLEARGYAPPLTAWDKDLSSAVCKIAAYDVTFHMRGANPADPSQAAIVLSKDWALKHVEKVAAGLAKFTRTTPARTAQAVAGVISLLNDDGTSEAGW